MSTRREVAEQAENIVTEEVARLQGRLRARDVAPTIVSLQEQLEAIRQEALLRHRAKLGVLTAEQEQALEALTRSIINKVAHGPISEMRRHASAETAATAEGELITAVRKIFRLGNG